MNDTGTPRWLTWAREIQALSQSGLMYSQSEFDTERYHRLTAIAAEIVAEHSTLETRALAASFYEQAGYATPNVDVRTCAITIGPPYSIEAVRQRQRRGAPSHAEDLRP